MPDLPKAINPSKVCPSPHNFGYLQNKKTGKTIGLSCKSLSCPVCGPRQKARIRHAATKYFNRYPHTRMWTLTISNLNCKNPLTHYIILKECWRRFITEIRRCKVLRKDQRAVKFFKCLDVHKTGFIHLHVIVNVWIKQSVLQDIWEHICMEVLRVERHSAQIWITGVPTVSQAANYVVSYITKATLNIEGIVRKWSKSIRTKFFDVKKSNGEWKYVFGIWISDDDISESHAAYLSSLVDKGITSQEYKPFKSLNIELFATNST